MRGALSPWPLSTWVASVRIHLHESGHGTPGIEDTDCRFWDLEDPGSS